MKKTVWQRVINSGGESTSEEESFELRLKREKKPFELRLKREKKPSLQGLQKTTLGRGL
jgi:alkylated DNA nucleotide flippase Atl1